METTKNPEEPGQTVTAPTHGQRLRAFEDLWRSSLSQIVRMVPQHISAERLFAVAMTARSRNPKLMQCSDLSVLRGVIIGAQLGLDVSGVGGKAYLVPYYNSQTKQLEAQFQVGWRGLTELARRTGQIGAIYAREVYEKEDFEYQDGLVQVLRHIPSVDRGDPGEIVGAWAVAVWANGYRQPEVMTRFQIDKVRASSKADDGPWAGWYGEMAKKTVIRRLMKKLPDSAEIARVLDIEDRVEAGQVPVHDIDLQVEAEQTALPEAPKTKTEKISERIKSRRQRAEPPPDVPEEPAEREPGEEG